MLGELSVYLRERKLTGHACNMIYMVHNVDTDICTEMNWQDINGNMHELTFPHLAAVFCRRKYFSLRAFATGSLWHTFLQAFVTSQTLKI